MFLTVQPRIFFFTLALIVLSFSLEARTQTENLDDFFQQARQQAFAGKRQEAKALCQTILQKNPDYVDARLLLGRINSWDGAYAVARRELRQVMAAKPDYADAREALIDVELWSGRPREALQLADEGLTLEPRNKNFLFKKAKALQALGTSREAIAASEEALQLDPDFAEARTLTEQLKDSFKSYRAKIEYTTDFFDKTFDPWQLVALSLSREQSWGTVIGRINYARRFNLNAAQVEIDAYPKFRKGTYAYLNLGYSSFSIFPKVRLGAELHQSLPQNFETSFGIRHLRFTSQEVTIYTGSVGKYHGNYWVSFRPFITPSSLGRSFSGNLTVRRYFGDAESYVSLVAGAGSAPDGRYTVLELIRLNSQQTSVEWRKRMGSDWFGVGSFGFENQELKSAGTRKRYTLSLGVERRF